MKYEQHITGGMITSIFSVAFSAYRSGLEQLWLICLTSIVFSLFPDMDTGSKSRRLLMLISLPVFIYLFHNGYDTSGYTLLSLTILSTAFKHRGFTHSLLGMVIFGGMYVHVIDTSIGMIDPINYAVAISIGYLTHLILDGHFKVV